MSLEILISAVETGTVTDEQFLTMMSDNNEDVSQILFTHPQSNQLFNSITNHFFTRNTAGNASDPLCKLFFNFYRTEHQQRRQFVLQFVPTLVEVYLKSLSQNVSVPGIEAVLIAIYNVEVATRGGQELMWISPSLKEASIYFIPQRERKKTTSAPSSQLVSPNNTNTSVLTEQTLRALNTQNLSQEKVEDRLPLISEGLLKASERDAAVKVALLHFHRSVGLLPEYVLINFCIVSARLASSGFPFFQNDFISNISELSTNGVVQPQTTRIPLSADILRSLVETLHYCVFYKSVVAQNGPVVNEVGKWALELLNKRVTYEVIPEVMIMISTVKHALARKAAKADQKLEQLSKQLQV